VASCGVPPVVAHETPSDIPIRSRWKAAGKFFRDGDTGATIFVKAVTWGPFPPGDTPDLDRELRRVRVELGANALRVYEPPGLEFLDRCAAAGLRVFIGFAWPHHVDFIADHRLFWDEKERFRRVAAEYRSHPALAGWLVANEIPAPLVRWMGPKKVNRALEKLIAAGREGDPEALFAYANYPSTEYLCPRGQDFVAFNIYLENRADYARYLRRLHHQAGDLPLLITEFGLDSRSHGEERQAETLVWHVTETARGGAAGTTLFAWSDRWHRGGKTIDDWDFGLTRRDGSAKPALTRVSGAWRDWLSPADALANVDFPRPKMSVVVCSYRGAALLRPCLESLRSLRYPNFEVILVNDGGDSAVAAVVREFPEVRAFDLAPHGGLSAARNLGAREATGEILVYTDDDCEADPDWLTWLAWAFAENDLAAAGGPNIPPPPENRLRAIVAAAPGGPAHVLLNDVEAEHLPGCNLAVRRAVWESVGGFDERFWTAGDDVDFCWRLIDAGHRIGFHPAAMVWHHRRFTVKAYLRQQVGYGRAEAMLMPLYPSRFGLRGGARWRGRVYAEGPAAWLAASGSRIYHGLRGGAPYQALYGQGSAHSPAALALDWMWVATGLALVAIGIGFGTWLPLMMGIGMVAFTTGRAITQSRRAAVFPHFDGLRSRIGVTLLALIQGPLRSFRRWFGIWRLKPRIPGGGEAGDLPVDTTAPKGRDLEADRANHIPGWTAEMAFWSERPVDRDEWLNLLQSHCAGVGLKLQPVAVTESADLAFETPTGHKQQVTTVVEYHDGGRSLLRVRVRTALPRRVLFSATIPLRSTLFTHIHKTSRQLGLTRV
jgi:GT2 family glycosyltransferase